MTRRKGGFFKPKPKGTAELEFTGGPYEGAYVKCSLGAPLRLWLRMTGADTSKKVAEVYQEFGDKLLIEWNLEEPASGEGMLEVDFDFAQAVISAWVEAKSGTPDPLGDASSSGSTSEGDTSRGSG